MTFSNQQLAWHFMTDEADEQAAWPLDMDPTTIENQRARFSAMKQSVRLYELILGLSVLYGVALFWVWLQAESHIALLEADIAGLQNSLVKELHEVNKDTTHIPMSNTILPLQFETNYLHFEISKRTASLIESAYLHVEDGEQTMALMESITAASDMKYRQLYQDFDLPLDSAVDKLTILIDPLPNKRELVADEKTLIVPYYKFAQEPQGDAQITALTIAIFVQLSQNIHERHKRVTQTPLPPMP